MVAAATEQASDPKAGAVALFAEKAIKEMRTAMKRLGVRTLNFFEHWTDWESYPAPQPERREALKRFVPLLVAEYQRHDRDDCRRAEPADVT